jgi:hexokinase
VKEVEKAFTISSSRLRRMVVDFHAEMRRGLAGESGSLKMLPAFVDCATGQEQGHFIGLDLGGTHFRVLLVALAGNGRSVVEQSSKFAIPKSVMEGEGTELFDFIARSILAFLTDHAVADRQMFLGFTFSFPVDQKTINSGWLVTWTKGFSASGVVGKDIVRMLADALHRHTVENLTISALVNDTVGTLLAKSYELKDCDAGVIFGTGTNACYRESTAAITKLSGQEKSNKNMIVNIEWGNFDLLPVNCYDSILDKESNNPGKQMMEKMISGMYLGPLVHTVLVEVIRKTSFFSKSFAACVGAELLTSDISDFESDVSPEHERIHSYLDSIGVKGSSIEERHIILQICRHISSRAARIAAAAISAVVTWMDPGLERHHSIAVDGTLYAKHPYFKQTIITTLQELHGGAGSNFSLTQSCDGSGIGAAIAAAVAE